MNNKRNLLLISVLIAIFILLAPILSYKYQVDKCKLDNSAIPNPCMRTYIPFEEGFPFKFYFPYGPGFAFYPFLEFLGNNIKLTNCQDTACEPPISPLIPFILDLVSISIISYIVLFSIKKLKRNG
jgi:hypothetical protein